MIEKMKGMRVGVVLLKILLLLTCSSSSSAGFWFGSSNHQSGRKTTLPPPPVTTSHSHGASSSSSSSSSSLLNRVGSSILLPVHGNVYPVGYYNVTLNIGHPSRPYFLDLDTGSDLTWLQCDAPCVQCTETPHPLYRPNNDLVPCRDPLCASLHSGDYICEDPHQCDYEIEYADHGSSLGVLVRDVFHLNFTNGAQHKPRLALGCGYNQIPGSSNHPVDGILGIGRGKTSMISQLTSQGIMRNVIGHCLSVHGGGYLFFGDGLYDSSRVSWAHMSREYDQHYSPGIAELIFGGKPTGVKSPLIFDSGSSYTYFNSMTYHALLSLMKKELSGKPLKEAYDDRTLDLCWKGRRHFRSISDVRKYFKPLAMGLNVGGRSKTQFEIPPESYLIISNKGNVCLGILNGTEVGLHDLNVVGDISMQDKLMIFHNEKQLIGWLPTNCDWIPKSTSNSF